MATELERITAIAEERLRQLVLAEELSGVGRWRISLAGSMTWSQAALSIHGQPKIAAPSLTDTIQLYHPKDRRRVARALYRVLEEGGSYEFRARVLCADGSDRFVSSVGRSERDSSGALNGVVGVVQDVTAQVELEEARARLERDERLIGLGRLAAGVAHEINNPLAYVEMSLRTLKNGAEQVAASPGWSAAIHDCLDGVERIQTIVSELNTFGRPALNTVTHTMNEVAMDAARLARAQLHSATKLRLHLGQASAVRGDKRRLTQVVLNLIRNADQALASQPGHIDVFTHSQDGKASLEVTDNGPGVPPEIRRRIFEPFFTTKAPNEGTGLGLALSSEIIRRHQGELTLVERGSFGACFRVVLPEVEPKNETQPCPARDSTRRARILIIDDEVTLLSAYRRFFQAAHTLETASSGAGALETLEKTADFDLIICDLMMPEMDGPALFDMMEQRWPEMAHRMVFSSGAAMSERARLFVESSGVPLVAKPIRPAELKQLLMKMEQRKCLAMSA